MCSRSSANEIVPESSSSTIRKISVELNFSGRGGAAAGSIPLDIDERLPRNCRWKRSLRCSSAAACHIWDDGHQGW
jgi:hypothetical protein